MCNLELYICFIFLCIRTHISKCSNSSSHIYNFLTNINFGLHLVRLPGPPYCDTGKYWLQSSFEKGQIPNHLLSGIGKSSLRLNATNSNFAFFAFFKNINRTSACSIQLNLENNWFPNWPEVSSNVAEYIIWTWLTSSSQEIVKDAPDRRICLCK